MTAQLPRGGGAAVPKLGTFSWITKGERGLPYFITRLWKQIDNERARSLGPSVRRIINKTPPEKGKQARVGKPKASYPAWRQDSVLSSLYSHQLAPDAEPIFEGQTDKSRLSRPSRDPEFKSLLCYGTMLAWCAGYVPLLGCAMVSRGLHGPLSRFPSPLHITDQKGVSPRDCLIAHCFLFSVSFDFQVCEAVSQERLLMDSQCFSTGEKAADGLSRQANSSGRGALTEREKIRADAGNCERCLRETTEGSVVIKPSDSERCKHPDHFLWYSADFKSQQVIPKSAYSDILVLQGEEPTLNCTEAQAPLLLLGTLSSTQKRAFLSLGCRQ